jgi:hypothetical protein
VRFVEPKEDAPRSRWRAGVTTFGPVGRIVITLVVVLLAPRSAGVMAVVLWPAYLTFAALVLHGTWKKDFVEPKRRERDRHGSTPPVR